MLDERQMHVVAYLIKTARLVENACLAQDFSTAHLTQHLMSFTAALPHVQAAGLIDLQVVNTGIANPELEALRA